MYKKIMTLSWLCIVNEAYAAENKTFNQLPTENEVIASGHPLTIHLYMSRRNYKENPKMGNSRDLGECLKRHPLLASPWVHEKGFTKEIEEGSKEGSATMQDIELIIRKNTKYAAVPEVAQRLLMANLMDAFKECSARHL